MMSASLAMQTWAQLLLAATWQVAVLALFVWACERTRWLRPPRVRHSLWWFVLLAPLALAPARLLLSQRHAMMRLPAPAAVVRATRMELAPPTAARAGAVAPEASIAGAARRREQPATTLVRTLALAWLLGCGAMALRLVVGHRRVRRMLATSAPVQDAVAQRSLRALCEEARVGGPVALRSSGLVGAAVVCGVVRPTVVIPEEWLAELPADQLRALLAHEVAHVQRRDVLASVLQHVLEAPLFFHPGAWVATRRIALAREEVCDSWALSRGIGRNSYVRSLAAAAERAHARWTVASLGVAESHSTLLRRVEAIMEGDVAVRASRLALIVLAVAVLVTVSVSATVQVHGDEPAANGGGGQAHESLQAPLPAPEHTTAELDRRFVHSYEVNRTVADFPDREDFTTPESACATMDRAIARGDQAIWRRITAYPRNREALPPADAPPAHVSPETAKSYLNARLLEVWVSRDRHAWVIAQHTGPSGHAYYTRNLVLQNGAWSNQGEDVAPTLAHARSTVVTRCLTQDRLDQARESALKHPEQFAALAAKLFDAIRGADYDFFLSSTDPDASDSFPAEYMAERDHPAWVQWVCTTFQRDPIVAVKLGQVSLNKYGEPAVPYRLTLKDGSVLSGELPFTCGVDAGGAHWVATTGLDWHLKGQD